MQRMTHASSLAWVALTLASLVVTSGCGTQLPTNAQPGAGVGQEILVPTAPPLPVTEEVTVSPGAGFVWVGGAWNWVGHWVWESGHWARPPRPGMTWEPHQFEYRGGKRVFIRGGWK
jgi:hypothetical protein